MNRCSPWRLSRGSAGSMWFRILGVLVLSALMPAMARAGMPEALRDLLKLDAKAMSSDGMIVLSSATSPTVAYTLRQSQDKLAIVLRVASWTESTQAPLIQLGIAAGSELQLTEKDARLEQRGKDTYYTFTVDPAAIGKNADDWTHLRMALIVRWPGGPNGVARQIERFGVAQPGTAFGAMPDSNNWAAVRVNDHIPGRDDLGRIVLKLEQPMNGKWTVVINDMQGRRIRTLIAGAPVEKGPQTLQWDGLDDLGRLVQPGEYQWKSIHHPGIEPKYLMAWGNGDEPGLKPRLSNHGHFIAACSNSSYAFLAAPITEGGCALIAMDRDGFIRKDFDQAHGTGYQGVAVAADDKYFYAAHDGMQRRERINKTGQWSTGNFISLTRYEIATSNYAAYSKNQFESIETYEYGPGSDDANTQKQISLAGMAVHDGVLYIASRSSQALLKIDPRTAKITGKIALPNPGGVTSDGKQLLAIRGGEVVAVDPNTGHLTPRITLPGIQPTALTIDERGRVYVADGLSHTVLLFNADGKPEGTVLGQFGGPYQGTFVPERMVSPTGLTLFGGRLWVTENRTNPKRAVAWDVDTKKVAVQKFGNPPYGGPASGMDPKNPSRWLGLGCVWELDFKTGAATVKSILQKDAGHLHGYIPLLQSYRWHHQDGRTFLIGSGKATVVSELMPDGSARDLAVFGGAHALLYSMNWRRIPVLWDEFERKHPTANFTQKYGQDGIREIGILWVDRNGDQQIQADEVEFAPFKTGMGTSGWGSVMQDLTLRMPLTRPDGTQGLITLAPQGFLPSGAPNYPSLGSAIQAAVPIDSSWLAGRGSENLQQPYIVDRQGGLIFNTSPHMIAFDASGQLRWQYPNRWANVHGSHNAPLPAIGQMQGSLSFLGIAPLDEQSDVVVINGNHGRFFVLTTDGFFLDEMFRDVRMGGPNDELHVGGEPFGGSFRQAETDKKYYLQTGGNGFRIYRLDGLDKIVRKQGTVKVEPTVLIALAAKAREKQAAAQAIKRVEAVKLDKAPKIDGQSDDWSVSPNVSWDRDGRFPVQVRVGFDANHLYLCYEVRDDSPWTNTGKDWTTLFKTGDSVDVQLGTNPKASPKRREPVVGDVRLLVAPFEGKPIAVLYRHKIIGTASSPVTFKSPWRGVTVDSVERVDDARIAVKPRPNQGYIVEVAVPLKTLGLTPAHGAIAADFGALYGDASGSVIGMRSYWSNHATALVNDVPGEIMLHPDAWGVMSFGE